MSFQLGAATLTNVGGYWVYVLLLLHPLNSLFSGITWVSRHQNGKPFWILLEQEMMRVIGNVF